MPNVIRVCAYVKWDIVNINAKNKIRPKCRNQQMLNGQRPHTLLFSLYILVCQYDSHYVCFPNAFYSLPYALIRPLRGRAQC